MYFCLFQTAIIKSGLQEESFEFRINQNLYRVDMERLIEIVEQKSELEKEFINRTIKEYSLLNRNILEFVEFLAKSHIMKIQL